MMCKQPDGFLQDLLQGKQTQQQQSPICLLYTSFFYQLLTIQPLAAVIASISACFYIYQQLNEQLLVRPDTIHTSYRK